MNNELCLSRKLQNAIPNVQQKCRRWIMSSHLTAPGQHNLANIANLQLIAPPGQHQYELQRTLWRATIVIAEKQWFDQSISWFILFLSTYQLPNCRLESGWWWLVAGRPQDQSAELPSGRSWKPGTQSSACLVVHSYVGQPVYNQRRGVKSRRGKVNGVGLRRDEGMSDET